LSPGKDAGPPLPHKLDTHAASPRKASLAAEYDEEEQQGSFSMESIYDALVGEDDEQGGPATAAAPAAGQQFPPWFANVPGHTPAELAQLIYRGQLPPQIEQLLRSRQAEFMKQLGGGEPPVPLKLLSRSAEAARTADLFDRHHHVHLLYWKRPFRHMSAEEVDALMAQQRALFKHSTYAEDYYYQQTASKVYAGRAPPKSVPPLMGVHRPVCLEPLEPPARPPPDMQAGTLGKLAFSTLKGPKPLVQLGLPAPETGPARATSSRALALLEAGRGGTHALLSVLEDAQLLALQVADMASVLPQLPPAEQPYFLGKQQQLVGALVYILNVFVARREDGSCLFGAVVRLAKGRQLLGRCLGALPLEQRSALLLFCVSQAPLLAALPDDSRTRGLHAALVRGCGAVAGPLALALLQAAGQAWTRQADFAAWAAGPFGAAVLAEALGALARARPPAGSWEGVVAGLLDALFPALPQLAAREPDHPAIALLAHLVLLLPPPQLAAFAAAVRPVLADARVRYEGRLTPPLRALLERLAL
jgi:hypothetical protein